MELKGKHLLIVGLGRSGLAAARHVVSLGAHVTVNDALSREQLQAKLSLLSDLPVTFELGHHSASLLQNKDAIILSPGISCDLELIQGARRKGIPIISELEVALYDVTAQVIAITGTNGKSTTTSLIGHLLEKMGFKVCVAGNIGIPLLEVLPAAKTSDVIVLEISSFQMETTPSLAPQVGVLLNITPDHLDRHPSFEAYANLKGELLRRVPSHGVAIFNAADEVVMRQM
ncbi:MAG: UDP-N-acetylmuramoyl-L-alanine--D-glutamate ligase, partial [Deltaproteobacteria bacterium]|nr:UDP-N-acetylmuramoyl-L-alanine--D-glutamate ligase [Deltaproteobacteria bacterium]